MKYAKADILPDELLREVQKYMNGVMVYIPKSEGLRKGWGVNSGGRAYIQQRNLQIRHAFAHGATVDQLTEQFFLSCDSIKKIVYTKMK
ncbi:CD3324 family protein [Paenibacillus sp. OV219]|uniref:CD3324 family protein n=1 Tax=Paenibacillus sp. OV219 TaxID=1884377 RepID=UPI000B861A09|nr:CD3324 family protein [Paenibacillus sp. OV219]